MGYGIDIEVFEKITFKGIRSNQETMDFLKKQAFEIFEDERIKWESQLENTADIDDPEVWCEFSHPASKKFEKYLYRWFQDVNYTISLTTYEDKLPFEIVGIFGNYLEEIIERISFEGFADEFIEDLYEEHKQKKEQVKL